MFRLIFPSSMYYVPKRACKLCFMHDGSRMRCFVRNRLPDETFRDGSKSTWMIPLQFNCCGIYGDDDYNGTAWWRDGQFSGSKRQVPLTCCVLKNSEVLYMFELIVILKRYDYRISES